MNMNEIATATRYNIPVVEVIINNHVLGMVRQWQTLYYGKRYSQTVLNDSVDYVKIAEGNGCKGLQSDPERGTGFCIKRGDLLKYSGCDRLSDRL